MKLTAINLTNEYFKNNPGAQTLGSSPGKLISNLVPNIIAVAGLVFLVLILYAGFNILSSSNSGNAQATAKFKQALMYGVIGFLIVVSAYFILQLVSITLTGNANTLTNPSTP